MIVRVVLSLLPVLLLGEKQASVFHPSVARERAARNAARFEWAANERKQAIADAARWVAMTDEDLWREMFGPRITRSHFVWSSGHCPACRRPVPMYDWKIDAWARPWKVECPHCREHFPKNDFAAFHRSGLDEHGLFDPKLADRSLLFNQEHPNPSDPLHRFGVDDGEGYAEGDKRWRFIGAYLLQGQWDQRIEKGVRNLAKAYTVTGDKTYAHKAGVLLDRIADVWPSLDYASQGLVYERARYGGGVAGYVWYAITSAYTVMYLAKAYDDVFDGIRAGRGLTAFLGSKDPRKRSFASIQRNIEDGILRHVLDNPRQIRTNYPGAERTLAITRTVLEWPANRDRLRGELDVIVQKAVAVDGLSGEKGLAGYASIAPQSLAEILEEFSALDPELLPYLLERNPKLRETYRFHFDTWIDHRFYPHSGDSGSFARRSDRYAGLSFHGGVYGFLGRLARATSDPLYWQMAWIGNGQKLDGLPHDIFAEDPAAYAASVKSAVDRHGTWPKVTSIDKQEWKIAILRHRTAPDAAVFLDYDSIPEGPLKSHYHFDAMNIGLFAKGLDLLPEFGYPAVQFGDWHTPQALWHKKTAAHNTIIVDGQDQRGGPSRTVLWNGEGPVQVMRAASPSQSGGSAYERTLVMVETGPADFYVFDHFHVAGGKDHAKHTHTAFATAEPFGLRLSPEPAPYGPGVLMRGFQSDRGAAPGWGVDWKIEDRFGYLAPGREIRLRYTDLTRGAEAMVAESWTVESTAATKAEWIPTVIARRRADGPGDLASDFVGVMEPYERKPRIAKLTRRDDGSAREVRVEVRLSDGGRDVLTSGPESVTWERRDSAGRVVHSGRTGARI